MIKLTLTALLIHSVAVASPQNIQGFTPQVSLETKTSKIALEEDVVPPRNADDGDEVVPPRAVKSDVYWEV
jgi:hypothetical protein